MNVSLPVNVESNPESNFIDNLIEDGLSDLIEHRRISDASRDQDVVLLRRPAHGALELGLNSSKPPTFPGNTPDDFFRLKMLTVARISS